MDMQVGFRLPKNLVERVDSYAKSRSVALGLKLTRTDATRMLLQAALDEAEKSKNK